ETGDSLEFNSLETPRSQGGGTWDSRRAERAARDRRQPRIPLPRDTALAGVEGGTWDSRRAERAARDRRQPRIPLPRDTALAGVEATGIRAEPSERREIGDSLEFHSLETPRSQGWRHLGFAPSRASGARSATA